MLDTQRTLAALIVLLAMTVLCPAFAAAPPPRTAPVVLGLWPGLVPGEQKSGVGEATVSGGVTRLTNVFTPRLLLFRPKNSPPNRPAVVVLPGGGYSILAQDLEGTEVAQWLNSLGYVAAVLDYRVPDNREGAFQDAQRAVSLLRSRARQFGVDPHRLGILGFSAGGHLAARTAAGSAARSYPAVDAADAASCRPDFALLIYPAYLLDPNGQPSAQVVPHAGMPPMFLTQTKDDPYLDVPGYADALRQAGVPAKCVIYDKAGHGYGLRLPASAPAHRWSEEAAKWLRAQTAAEGAGA